MIVKTIGIIDASGLKVNTLPVKDTYPGYEPIKVKVMGAPSGSLIIVVKS